MGVASYFRRVAVGGLTSVGALLGPGKTEPATQPVSPQAYTAASPLSNNIDITIQPNMTQESEKERYFRARATLPVLDRPSGFSVPKDDPFLASPGVATISFSARGDIRMDTLLESFPDAPFFVVQDSFGEAEHAIVIPRETIQTMVDETRRYNAVDPYPIYIRDNLLDYAFDAVNSTDMSAEQRAQLAQFGAAPEVDIRAEATAAFFHIDQSLGAAVFALAHEDTHRTRNHEGPPQRFYLTPQQAHQSHAHELEADRGAIYRLCENDKALHYAVELIRSLDGPTEIEAQSVSHPTNTQREEAVRQTFQDCRAVLGEPITDGMIPPPPPTPAVSAGNAAPALPNR